MRILDAFSNPNLVSAFRSNGFREGDEYQFVRYAELAVEDPSITDSRKLTGFFGELGVSVGIIPPGTLKVPVGGHAGAMGFHNRTVLQIGVGPNAGDPHKVVEEGRRILDALEGQIALRVGRLLINRTLGERLERVAYIRGGQFRR